MVTRGAEKISVRLRNDSHASWLWLQAALFDAVRRDVEQQLFAIDGAARSTLKGSAWVTYLSWNIDSGEDGARKIASVLGGCTDQEDARIGKVFGATPKKLSRWTSTCTTPNRSSSERTDQLDPLVEYLVESHASRFAWHAVQVNKRHAGAHGRINRPRPRPGDEEALADSSRSQRPPPLLCSPTVGPCITRGTSRPLSNNSRGAARDPKAARRGRCQGVG